MEKTRRLDRQPRRLGSPPKPPHLPHLQESALVENCARFGQVFGSRAVDDGVQLPSGGKVHFELEEETIELGFGVRVGAFHLQGVLRRQHE